MNRHHSPRIKAREHRVRQVQTKPGIPSAFMQLFTPESFAMGAIASNQMQAAARGNYELAPGCPIFRWNRGKYDRRNAERRRQSAHRWALVTRLVGVGTSTLMLALVFVLVGVH